MSGLEQDVQAPPSTRHSNVELGFEELNWKVGVGLFDGELLRAALGDHPAVVDDHDVVGEGFGFLHEVGSHNHRDVVFDFELDQIIPKVLAGTGVKSGARFI